MGDKPKPKRAPYKAPPCLLCHEDGRDFRGTPKAERLVFSERALWDLHKLRQALDEDSAVLADEVSEITRRMENVAELVLELGPNIPEPS